MKNAPTKLIYHSLHKRPMPGCLPLFFLLAGLATAAVIWLVEVQLPAPFRPRGTGTVSYRNDELTRFQVRQRSALPLRLPGDDPAARLPEPAHALPLQRAVELQAAPPLPITREPRDSAVLDAETLLRLPPAIPDSLLPQEKEVQP